MTEDQGVKLVFAEPPEGTPEREYLAQRGIMLKPMEIDLDSFVNAFKGYKVDSIELTCSGTVQTGGFLQLFVSASGNAGVTVTLKPQTG
ncbi:MAG: hypothetical protein ACXV2F_04160 [Halobacteriota archaeon]